MTETAAPGSVLHAAARSDPGRVRTNNEDVPLVDADRGLYGVIDGVGGQAAGEVAAAIAADVIQQRLARPLGTPAERVREAIALANNEIFRRAGTATELAGMTCVVTLAIVADGRLTIGHVGDSRLYKLRGGRIDKLTHDHSPVGEREDAREMSEADAMRHPRRNEVFRDVGGALRDKDEDEYVEVIEDSFEADAAILVCSDGLTDMIPSGLIERLVRQHAGSPGQVAEALIAAANEAGGRDNVTVVYAEGPEFARASSGQPSRPADTALPGDAPLVGNNRATATKPQNGTIRLALWIVRSRITWFAVGATLGVLVSLWLVWRTAETATDTSRTITVSDSPLTPEASLAAVLKTSRSGDVIRLERGRYAEQVTLADGVSLVARVPGDVTFVRPPATTGEWVAITAGGDLGGRISGINIESTADLPIDAGIRITGQSRTVDLVELSGPMTAGIELGQGSSVTLTGNALSVQGTSLALGDHAQAVATANVFLRTGRGGGPPVKLGDAAQASLRRNVFIGYGTDLVKGATPAERQQHLGLNVVVAAEPSPVR